MRVGILTSHRVPCGVAEFSNRLADALARQPDVQPVILAGRADEHRSIPEESVHEVHDVAQIGLWRDDSTYTLDIEKILGLGLDALMVEYQSMLFHQAPLADLAVRFPGPTAVTFHDNCQRPDFPANAFDLRFTHRHGVGIAAEVIPFGIENRPSIIRTFGLGRTRSDLIAPICERNGWTFETAASHEPIHGGGQAWMSHEDLIDWLRGADVVVLWYDPQSMAGSSQAARTAMAARRPLIVNDTEWFADLPRRAYNFQKVHDLDELEAALHARLAAPYVEANSWDRVAALLVDRYQRVGLAAAA